MIDHFDAGMARDPHFDERCSGAFGLRRSLLCAAAVCVVSCWAQGRAWPQAVAPPGDASKIITSLTSTLDSGHAHPNQAFQMKVLAWWATPGCTLHQGATVYAHVSSAERYTRAAGRALLALSVDSADCEGHPHHPLLLVISALADPDADIEERMHSVLPHESGGGGMGGMASTVGDDQSLTPPPDYSQMRAGEVRGVPHVKLAPASQGEDASTLTDARSNVRLSTHTVFVLSPASVAIHLSAGDGTR